jgi:hypothetical protein
VTITSPPSQGSARTGAWFRDPHLFDDEEVQASKRRTGLKIARVDDPVLRDALKKFDDALEHKHMYGAATLRDSLQQLIVTNIGTQAYAHLQFDITQENASSGSKFVFIIVDACTATSSVSHATETEEADSVKRAVAAVQEVAGLLQVPINLVLKAAAVSKRTYHTWRRGDVRRPRLASYGRLWELQHLARELVEVKGRTGVQHWLSEDRSRMRALRSGSLDELAGLAYSSSNVAVDRRPPWIEAGSPIRHQLKSITPSKLAAMEPSDIVEPER